jgi:KUP system potassium uptake protein
MRDAEDAAGSPSGNPISLKNLAAAQITYRFEMSEPHSSNKWALSLVALGVVFGDIGTSPLYALKECLAHSHFNPLKPDLAMVYGPISLMFWSLTIMVSVKYLLLVTRATNQGEGGVFALLSLLRSKNTALGGRVKGFILLALLGAALLYGDGMITPAISVLSAVEGLEKLNPGLHRFIVPVACVILLGLFLLQKHGTAKIGVGFGPVMILWFGVLAGLGLYRFLQHPEIISALSPHHGIGFLAHHGREGIVLMGMVLLAVTGCEALYADIGHFGQGALQRAWFFLVYPALTLNYLGQGALVSSTTDPQKLAEVLESPFYSLAPDVMLMPLIILATLATVIASQAMITGVFSLTLQAVQLGFMPRLKIVHTNPDVRGQIYMPQVNYMLMVACIGLVLFFKSSSNLASAYGLSVSMDMLLTSFLFFLVAWRIWNWAFWKALLPILCFMCIETGYFLGSLAKFMDGAWFPLVIGSAMWIIMKTWTDGRAILYATMLKGRLPVEHLISEIKKNRIIRVPGTAVFMSSSAEGLPLALLHHLKHNKALHEQVILLSVKFEQIPHVAADAREEVEKLHDEFFRVVLHYGFAESPQVLKHLCLALADDTKLKPAQITFYQSRELLLSNGPAKMAVWRKKLFVFLSRISRPATGYFELPPRQVIELGIQLEI